MSFWTLITNDDETETIHVMEFTGCMEKSRKWRKRSTASVLKARTEHTLEMQRVEAKLRRWQSHPVLKPIIRSEENRGVFNHGELIFAKGSHGRSMYFVAEGAVEFYHAQPDPNLPPEMREQPLGCCTYGDIFGEGSLLTAKPRVLAAVAKGRTLLRELPVVTLESVLPQNPDLQRQLSEFAAVAKVSKEREDHQLRTMELETSSQARREMIDRAGLSEWEKASLHAVWLEGLSQKTKEEMEAQVAELNAQREEREAVSRRPSAKVHTCRGSLQLPRKSYFIRRMLVMLLCWHRSRRSKNGPAKSKRQSRPSANSNGRKERLRMQKLLRSMRRSVLCI